MKMITWKQFGIFVLLLIGIILAFSPVNQGTRSNEFAVEIAKQSMSKEDHMSAVAWNAFGLIHTQEMIKRGLLPKEFDDLPNYLKKKKK